jgi:hypothetical protein
LCSARGTTVETIIVEICSAKPLNRHQLQQPDREFIRSAARIGGDTPTRLHLAPVIEREDDIGIAHINGQQHAASLRLLYFRRVRHRLHE